MIRYRKVRINRAFPNSVTKKLFTEILVKPGPGNAVLYFLGIKTGTVESFEKCTPEIYNISTKVGYL